MVKVCVDFAPLFSVSGLVSEGRASVIKRQIEEGNSCRLEIHLDDQIVEVCISPIFPSDNPRVRIGVSDDGTIGIG